MLKPTRRVNERRKLGPFDWRPSVERLLWLAAMVAANKFFPGIFDF